MKVIDIIKNSLSLVAIFLLTWASCKFLDYNAPIIKHAFLNMALIGICLALFVSQVLAFKFRSSQRATKVNRLTKVATLFVTAGVMVVVFLESALWDYFQPYSCHDDVIYMSLVGILLFILRFIIDVFTPSNERIPYILAVLLLAMPASLGLWKKLQKPFSYGVEEQSVTHLFSGGDAGYDRFRIPSICVIPEGSLLANGDTLIEDRVLAYAEARRNGSLDQGDIDLVQRISADAGLTWSAIEVTQTWQPGIGKIGNPTPVFDKASGIFWMFYIAGDFAHEFGYNTWYMSSADGGFTWSEPQKFGNCTVGPGHGIQIENGSFKDRLVIPAYNQKGAFTLISDDQGQTWTQTDNLGVGNETEIAQADTSGNLVMITRIQIPLSKPHGELHKLLCYSKDGGAQWTAPVENTDLRTPICMSSIVRQNEDLYYSYPDQYYNRSNLTIARSHDSGQSWSSKHVIYPGPAGYSDLAGLSNNDVLVLFENGAVDYDERITLVRISEKK